MARRLSAVAGRAVALGAAVVVVGCAEAAPPTLAEGTLQAALPAAVWAEEPGLVDGVECPALDTDLIAQTTVCTALLDADPITIDVRVDEDGVATADVREPLFVVADAAEQLARRLADDLDIEAPAVECDRRVLVVAVDATLGCIATNDGRPIDFVVRLVDPAGGWIVELMAAE